jgi:hypothetical protein
MFSAIIEPSIHGWCPMLTVDCAGMLKNLHTNRTSVGVDIALL